MQIAEQITKNGMSGSGAFCDYLFNLVADSGITRIIETGTYYGTGTTAAILRGLLHNLAIHGSTFDFYSIECNPAHYLQAQRNLGDIAGLHLINGLSVARTQIPVDTTFNVPDHIVVDHFPQFRNELYRKEVTYPVADNQLGEAIKALGGCPELVLLDSAGHMGWIEFCYLMERIKCTFLLALDDTYHVKHYDTMEFIRGNPKQFEVIWEVESEFTNATSGSKFGSAVIKVNGNN
jgi:hypothetical protein